MSFTPNRRLGFSLPPSPAATPRSEKRPADLRWADGVSHSNRGDRDSEVNVQVVVRCRPLSDEDQRMGVQNAIFCNEQRREVAVLQRATGRQLERTFTFDKVFGPKTQQKTVYEHAISPIVNDVLEGFNCTVFAYGQTGTGKTYTMEGEIRSKSGELSAEAGIIPRSVRQICDTLDARKADYSMKVTFLELYNEEIFDLLAPEDCSRFVEDKQRRPISLMEDGKGGAVIRGLQEEVVYSINEIYNLLECGSARRRTGDTLLNKQSSRSHSIFSITVHVKEAARGDEELIKCGRLNLVDLAGSENVSRSGVQETRAREAGEMNKSLLTLGRVITALVEHSAHVPYRDSKLTRLLRESLGGKAKTCIIATISSSAYCLEETLSTLDYAYRAKAIRNKPEANQKLSRSVLLKDLYLEIERMKQDVKAAREKNGVHIPYERFLQDEAEKKAMSEKIDRLEFDLDLVRKQADTFQELYHSERERNLDLDCETRKYKANLEETKRAFYDLQEDYRATNLILKEKEFLISKLLCSENAIVEEARGLHSSLEGACKDIVTLQSEIDQKTKIETENKQLILTFRSHLHGSLKDLNTTIAGSISQQRQLLKCMDEHACSFIARKCEITKILESKIKKMKDTYSSGIAVMKELANALDKKASSDVENLKSSITSETMAVENFLVTAASEAEQVLHEIKRSLAEQKGLVSFSTQQQEAVLQKSLENTQVISKTTIDFFNDLANRASRLVVVLEENHVERSQQLANFQKAFQEASVKEETEALEKIAGILSTLTSNKTKMVSEAIMNMKFRSFDEKMLLELELSDLCKVTSDAKRDWIKYIEKVESQVQEDTFSAAEIQATMSNVFSDCSEKVAVSMQHWRNAQSSIDALHIEYGLEIESSMEESTLTSQTALEDFMSKTSSTIVEFDLGISDLLRAVNNSLLLDHDAKMEMEPISAMCLDQLKSLQDSHTENIAEIRNHTENCLLKEYKVDQSTHTTTKQSIILPSIESIEALRMTSANDLVMKMGLKSIVEGKEGRHFHLPSETGRDPFMTIN